MSFRLPFQISRAVVFYKRLVKNRNVGFPSETIPCEYKRSLKFSTHYSLINSDVRASLRKSQSKGSRKGVLSGKIIPAKKLCTPLKINLATMRRYGSTRKNPKSIYTDENSKDSSKTENNKNEQKEEQQSPRTNTTVQREVSQEVCDRESYDEILEWNGDGMVKNKDCVYCKNQTFRPMKSPKLNPPGKRYDDSKMKYPHVCKTNCEDQIRMDEVLGYCPKTKKLQNFDDFSNHDIKKCGVRPAKFCPKIRVLRRNKNGDLYLYPPGRTNEEAIVGMKVENQQSEIGEFSYEPKEPYKPTEEDYQSLHRSQKTRCKFESHTNTHGVKCLDPGLIKLEKKYDDTVMLYAHKCEKPCDFVKRADEIEAQERADARLTVTKKRLSLMNMCDGCLPARGKLLPSMKESKLKHPCANYPPDMDPKRTCPQPCNDEVARMDDLTCWKPKRKKLPSIGSKIAARHYSTYMYPKGKTIVIQNFFASKTNAKKKLKKLETKINNYCMTEATKITAECEDEGLKGKPSLINITNVHERLRKRKNVSHLGSVQALKPVEVNWEIPAPQKFRYHSKDLRKHLLHIPIPLTCYYEASLRCAVRRFATWNPRNCKEERKKITRESADRFTPTNNAIEDGISTLQPRKNPVNKIAPTLSSLYCKKIQPENELRRSLRLSAKKSMEKIPRKRSNTRNRKSFFTKTKPFKSLSCTNTKDQRVIPPYCCFTDHNPRWSSKSEFSLVDLSKHKIASLQQSHYLNLRRAYSTKSKLSKKSSEPSNKTTNERKLLKRTTSSLFQSLDRRISTRSRLNLIQKTTGRKISFIQTDQIGKLNKKYYVHAVTRKLKPKEDILQSSLVHHSTNPKLNPQEHTLVIDQSSAQEEIDKSPDINVDPNNIAEAAIEKTPSGSQKIVERQTSIKTSKIPRLKKQADIHSNKKTDESPIEQMGMNKNEVALIKNIIEFVSQNEAISESITCPVLSKKKSRPIFPVKRIDKYPPSSNHEYLLRVLNIIEDNRRREKDMPDEPHEFQTSQEETCELCNKGDVHSKYWLKNQETNTPEKDTDFNKEIKYLNTSKKISLKCLNKDEIDVNEKDSKEVLCEKSIKLVKFKGSEPVTDDKVESKTENYAFERNVVLEPQTPDENYLFVSRDATTDINHLKNKIEHIEKNIEVVKELQKDSIQKIEEDKGHILQSTKEVQEEVKKSVSEIVKNQRESLQEAKTQVERALDLIRTTNVNTKDKENETALLKSNKPELWEETQDNLLKQSLLPGNKKSQDPISILKKIVANNPMVSNNLPQFREAEENLTPAGGLKGLEWGTAIQQVHLKRGSLSSKIPLKGGITEIEEMAMEVPIMSQRRLASGNAKGCAKGCKIKASCEKPKMKCKIGPKKVNLCKKDEKKPPRIICAKKKTWFQRFIEYFKARPGCPSPAELKQKKLRLKAIKAAEAAGLNVCERKLDKCGQIQKLILVQPKMSKPCPSPAPKATCKEKRKPKVCKPKKKCLKPPPPPCLKRKERAPSKEKSKSTCCCTLPGKSKASNSSSRSFATKSDSKTSGPSCRKTQERNHSTYIGFNREPHKGLEFIQNHFPYKNFTHCPSRPNVYVGKMYEVKLSKIGVKNALIPRNPDEEPYTYCQICKIVPKGIVNKKVPDDPILMNINVEAKKGK